MEGAVGPISEQSASPVVTRSTADATQTAVKLEIEEPDRLALEEISSIPDLGVTRVFSAAQLEDTSTLTPAEVEVLRARQLEEHGEVLSPAIPSVPDTPDTPTWNVGVQQPRELPAETSRRGHTKEKTAKTSQRS